jgi:predicted dithiol-disulfide oxidoreductase (DUF899 family)
MPEHRIGTGEEWQVARSELAELEAEQAVRDEEIKRKRRELPWVPVEQEYEFLTEDGKKQLAELFEGRSQLLAYNIMYGPDFEIGACPGCTNLADGFEGLLLHMNKRDVTLICFSRAPIDRLAAYKQRMGWQFPYVSTYGTDFPFDFGLALTEEQARPIGELQEMVQNPPAGSGSGPARSGPGSRTACARIPATSRSPGRTEPCTTPTRSRHQTRSSLPTSASCSTGRRSRSPTSRSTTARTSTPTEISRSRRNASSVRSATARR